MTDYEVKVSSTSGCSFGTLCWVVWIVFMILYYGTGTIASWPVFWIWFPFWLPFAVGGAFFIISFIIAAWVTLMDV